MMSHIGLCSWTLGFMTQYPLSCELRIGMTYQVDIRQTDSVNRVTVLKQDFTQYVITGIRRSTVLFEQQTYGYSWSLHSSSSWELSWVNSFWFFRSEGVCISNSHFQLRFCRGSPQQSHVCHLPEDLGKPSRHHAKQTVTLKKALLFPAKNSLAFKQRNNRRQHQK